MIFGIYDPAQPAETLKQTLLSAVVDFFKSTSNRFVSPSLWAENSVALGWLPTGTSSLDETAQPYQSAHTASVVEGKLYNLKDLQADLKVPCPLAATKSGQVLGDRYEQRREDFLEGVNGKYAFGLWDKSSQQLLLGRDRFGIQSIFYTTDGNGRLAFASSTQLLLKVAGLSSQLNEQAVLDYLLYCYNPGNNTFFQGIYKLPASHLLRASSTGVTLHQYWQLSFEPGPPRTEADYCNEILELIKDAVALRMDPQQAPGVLLSGGIDSSTMVSLSSQLSESPLSTFSFRCQGKSYDESYYARLVAERYGTQHTEVAYEPDSLTHLAEAAAAMDEPFCDIGIEIATYLLGQAASGKVSYVFSGEGGDELFAGHPVYSADKAAPYIDRIPKPLLSPLLQALQNIPDTDQKKNIQVKLKRVAYSLGFPPELLSHRWRTYYTAAELSQLCSSDLLANSSADNLFDTMLKHTQVDGPDIISRCLNSDYWTLVNFYLRRLELLRQFGIENRLPLLDYRLVEYAAKIPSDLKLRGFSNTKYIYKEALRGTLPNQILFDRPKLGHSVPMKNWMRQEPVVRDWIHSILSSATFNNRGLFCPTFVQQLLNEHFSKTHNHSHRIWSLVVLELWFRNNA